MSTFSTLASVVPVTPYCAFMTDDAEAILNYAADGADQGFGSALVTLIEIRGGASRALGAQMAVRGDGGFCGYVSGGCTESAVAAEAIEAIRDGTDRYLRLGEGSRFFDISLPCGGGITLAIHVVRSAKPLRQVLSSLGSRRRIALTYDPVCQTIAVTKPPTHHVGHWQGASFVRCYRPTPRVILCGRGIELHTTARLCRASDFEVLSFDGRTAKLKAEDIDKDAAVVLLFHDIDSEIPFLKTTFKRNPFYIGALGSKRTHERRCEALWASGYTQMDTDRIKAPIGIFGPARDATSLGLSVMADIAKVHSLAL